MVQALRKYNSMQDLRTPDDTDAPYDSGLPRQRGDPSNRSTWYGPQPGVSSQNFNPDEDLAILERQYRAEPIQEETYRERSGDMPRSSSDM